MRSIFLSQISSLHPIIYLVIFVAMIFEGDVVAFTSLFLARAGYLNLYDVIAALVAGALIGDILWYFAGHTYEPKNRVLSWLFELSAKLTSRFDNHLKERTPHTIFLSKFAYGLHHLILLRAGVIKIEFKRLIRIDSVATAAWLLIIGGLGYVSGASFSLIKHRLQYAEVGILGIILVFFIGGEIVSRIIRMRI